MVTTDESQAADEKGPSINEFEVRISKSEIEQQMTVKCSKLS